MMIIGEWKIRKLRASPQPLIPKYGGSYAKYDHGQRRAAAQPEKRHGQHPQEPTGGADRAFRLRQVYAGVRHFVPGRPATVHGIAGHGGVLQQTAHRQHHRTVAVHQRGSAQHQPQPALHRRHRHGSLHVPARALRPSGTPSLSDLRRGRPPIHLRGVRRRGRRRHGGRGRHARPERDLSLPALWRTYPGTGHGALLLQQTRRRVPHVYRSGDDAPGQPEPTARSTAQRRRGRRAGVEQSAGAILRIDAAQRRAILRLRLRPPRAHRNARPGPARPAALRDLRQTLPAALPRQETAHDRGAGQLRGHRHRTAAPLRRSRPQSR